jgi:hypothetical protein
MGVDEPNCDPRSRSTVRDGEVTLRCEGVSLGQERPCASWHLTVGEGAMRAAHRFCRVLPFRSRDRRRSVSVILLLTPYLAVPLVFLLLSVVLPTPIVHCCCPGRSSWLSWCRFLVFVVAVFLDVLLVPAIIPASRSVVVLPPIVSETVSRCRASLFCRRRCCCCVGVVLFDPHLLVPSFVLLVCLSV